MDCSQHKKELFGQTDMKVVAEAIGDLHYKTLAEFLNELGDKLKCDSRKDADNGRFKLSDHLWNAGVALRIAYYRINKAWQISKPFMNDKK